MSLRIVLSYQQHFIGLSSHSILTHDGQYGHSAETCACGHIGHVTYFLCPEQVLEQTGEPILMVMTNVVTICDADDSDDRAWR